MTPDARALHVIPTPDGAFILKRGVTELVVSGEGTEAVVVSLLPLLDGSRDPAEAVASLPEAEREAAGQLLDALVARRMLGEGPIHPDPLQDAFYANFGAPGREAPAALGRAHVALHGTGLVARRLAAALDDLGVGRVTVVDDPGLRTPVPTADGPVGDGPVGDGGPVEGADLLVAASDVGQEGALAAVGRRALAGGVRFLPAWVSELVGFVGPLVVPNETACLRCYQLRVDSNAKQLTGRRALREHVGAHPEVGAAAGLLPPMASVVAQIAAMEVAMALGGFAPAGTTARSVEINLVSFRSAVRRVLKVPRCPDCSEASRHTPRVFRTGPQIAE